MFVTKSQIFIFIACLSFGGVCGIFYSFSAAVKYFIKNKFIKAIPDVIASLFIALIYVNFSFSINFPNVRAYMMAGVFVGIFLYLKSFHILLAKNSEKIYNICKNKILKAKDVRKQSKRKNTNNRRKGKKAYRGKHGGRSFVAIDSSNSYGVSINTYRRLQ